MDALIDIYEVRDRQRTKYFTSIPSYSQFHGIYVGDEIVKPKDLSKVNLITKFKVKIIDRVG